MIALLVFVIVPAVVALFTAGVNVGVCAHRRNEHGHRWLAIACASSAVLVGSTALLYVSRSAEEALLARELLMIASMPAAFSILRFWSHHFGANLGRIERFATVGILLIPALGLIPGAFYSERSLSRSIAFSAATYVDVEPTLFGALTPFAFIPLAAFLIAQMVPILAGRPEKRLMISLAALCLAGLTNDMLVLGAWLDGPLLFGSSFAVMGVVLTGYMLRRFVASMERVEASADLLQRAAESRAWELREADLRLAHGARLAALGTLAAGLAHEINNPVAFVRSNLNYLDELSREAETDAELDEVLSETEEGVARVRGIVDELVRMSTQSDARFAYVDVVGVVESVLPTLRFEARGDVEIEARLAPVPHAWGDRNLLGQIVANLVVNAIQAIRGAGAPGAVRIQTFADPAHVVLEVSDTGPGVPPELAGRIFEPFFTTKPAGEGTGLGLAVARQLVERLGGTIALAPSERGARFRVELPRSGGRPLRTLAAAARAEIDPAR